jgi:cytochrome c-type biogenesis protein CcmE
MIQRKHYYILGAALLLGFAGFSLSAFRNSLTPYVGFEEARRPGAGARVVQIAGGLEKDSSRYDTATSSLQFTLVDTADGGTMPVRYEGLRPANFEDAVSIVAIGRWDAGAGRFEASKLLVKCPSKYQGAEVTKSY